jgi:endonuclease/exonuclease/phosphatase family metal-dependent hydrolase
MARKKSRFSKLVWLLLTVFSGGGLGGYVKPDLPVLGPLVGKVVATASDEVSDGAPSLGLPGNGRLAQAVGAGAATPPVQSYGGQVSAQLASSQRPANSLLISSFNIQVLGKSKMSKPQVVNVLAQVIRQFDIVAIQEVRAKEDDILPALVGAVNSDGSRYSFLIGPRLGRTVSTEQYAFVFDTTRVEHEPRSVGTISDPADMLHREPFVARFRARTHSPDRAFTFWLVNTHTDPDEVPQEVSALADVFQVMQTARAEEDDVILLGDLNASSSELGRLGQIPGIMCAVNGVMTNTRQNKAYDNILFHRQQTSEFTGRWGVFNLEQVFGLSQSEALKVSDHLPIWAEFHLWEMTPQVRFADQAPGLRR